MPREIYRYVLGREASIIEAIAIFELALVAVQSLHGEPRTRMDTWFRVCPDGRTIDVDASTHVGKAITQVFAGLLAHAFGACGFAVNALATAAERDTSASKSRCA